MPQVDLETLISACAGGGPDGKIACETLSGPDDPPEADLPKNQVEESSDLPPDSFWLSKDAELDWFDRHAFYERKESTKGGGGGGAGPTSANSNPVATPNSATSQRFAANLKSKASYFGLPKTQKNHVVDSKHRRNCTATLIPKRTASLVEPSSPKVSCMGRVRSKKDKNRRSRTREEPETRSRGRAGFFSSIRGLFVSGCRGQEAVAVHAPTVAAETPARKSTASMTAIHDILERLPPERREIDGRSTVESEPPGLGAMKRFTSGRKSDAWAGSIESSSS